MRNVRSANAQIHSSVRQTAHVCAQRAIDTYPVLVDNQESVYYVHKANISGMQD